MAKSGTNEFARRDRIEYFDLFSIAERGGKKGYNESKG